MPPPESFLRLPRLAGVTVCLGLWWLCILAGAPGQPSDTYRQKTRTFHTAEEFARTRGGKVEIQRRADARQDAALRQLPIRLPVSQFTVIGIESPQVKWIGSPHGAVR
jgi:hypothetical protein